MQDPRIPSNPAAIALSERSRRSFLRRSIWGVAGSAGAIVAITSARDALADGGGALMTDRANFISIRKHENAHVDFLVNALGANARPKPTFQKLEQNTLRHFFATTQALENTGVGAYLGAAPFIDNPAHLAAAGSIATIESRHAGWINSRVGDPITGNVDDLSADPNFDIPLTPDEVDAAAGAFIASLNGGPAITYSTTPSPTNDIAILNFALALEYLEAEFYNINVDKFYKRH